MGKPTRVMGNPKLDRAFRQAYEEALRAVDRLERDKSAGDRLDAFADLFEDSLRTRDLTPGERTEIVGAFKSYVADTGRREDQRRKRRRSMLGFAGGSAALLFAVVFGIYLLAARPFTSVSSVEAELEACIEQVDESYGDYANRFYKLLDRYDRRLGDTAVADYNQRMREVLDREFSETLAKVVAGEIRYYDDARKWAGLYPEAELRSAKREEAQNALAEGLKRSVGGTVEDVVDGAKNLLQRVGDFVREKTGNGD